MRTKKQGPIIFEYNDYRKFLKDLFAFKKKTNRHFTYRHFSQKAGFVSPSALKDVIEGRKNLTHKSILKYAVGFDLNKGETEYFTNLVYFNQCKGLKEKNYYYGEILRLQDNKRGKTLTANQYQYYTNWFNSAIRELISTKGFVNDIDWISRNLIPNIKPGETKKALSLLEEIGLVKLDSNKNITVDNDKIEVNPEVNDADVNRLSIRNFNRSMIELGKDAIERFDTKEREISGLTLGVSEDSINELRQLIREFKKKLLNYVVNDKRPSQRVYQLNVQFFPLSKKK